MTRRVTASIPDALHERLRYLADHYETSLAVLLPELLENAATICESHIQTTACEQIAWLVAAEPAGNA